MASYILYDKSGTVKSVSSDLKNKVSVGSKITDSEAKALTTKKTSSTSSSSSSSSSKGSTTKKETVYVTSSDKVELAQSLNPDKEIKVGMTDRQGNLVKGLTPAKIYSDRFDVATQGGTRGVAVIRRPDETYEDALSRSAFLTADLLSKDTPGKEVSVGVSGFQRTYSRQETFINAPSSVPNFMNVNQNIVDFGSGLKRTEETISAKEGRERGIFTMYNDDVPIVVRTTRTDYTNPINKNILSEGGFVGQGTKVSVGSAKDLTLKKIWSKDLGYNEAVSYRNYEFEPVSEFIDTYNKKSPDTASGNLRLGLTFQKFVTEPISRKVDNKIAQSREEKKILYALADDTLTSPSTMRVGSGFLPVVSPVLGAVDFADKKRGGMGVVPLVVKTPVYVYDAGLRTVGGGLELASRNPVETSIDYVGGVAVGRVYSFSKGLLLPVTTRMRYTSESGSTAVKYLKGTFISGAVVGGGLLVGNEIVSSPDPYRAVGRLGTQSFVQWTGFARGMSQGMKSGETFLLSNTRDKKKYSRLITDLKKSNLMIVPDYTIERSKSDLLALQGKRATVSSVTPSAWLYGKWISIVGERGPTVGPFRSENMLLNMYFSGPYDVKSVAVKGFTRMVAGRKQVVRPFTRSYSKTPLFTAYSGDKASDSVGAGVYYSFSFGRQQSQAIQVTKEISSVPRTKTGSIKDINEAMLEKLPGKIVPAPENVAKNPASVEDQVITPAKILEPGYEWTRGGLMKKSVKLPRIVYYEKPSGTLANYDVQSGKNINYNFMDSLFGPRYTRVEVISSKLKAGPVVPVEPGNINTVPPSQRGGKSLGGGDVGRGRVSAVPVQLSAVPVSGSVSSVSGGLSSIGSRSRSLSSMSLSSGSRSLSSMSLSSGSRSLSSMSLSSSGLSSSISRSSSGSGSSSGIYSSGSGSGSSSSIYSSGSGSSVTRTLPPRITPPGFSLPSLGQYQTTKPKTKKMYKLKGDYSPSVTAIIFNIKSSKKPRKTGLLNYESGLVLRPQTGVM